ncbi:hypothetical protein TorRG33x02_192240 [Trema orientale]|uniref:Uncharacterized protein n=1 Tax=Trema orientale TaxID=63057 RepID=A0A2P5EHF7_TREOI|nr:hypothetical protein TorRG33x02_192240 [Trema orientale]
MRMFYLRNEDPSHYLRRCGLVSEPNNNNNNNCNKQLGRTSTRESPVRGIRKRRCGCSQRNFILDTPTGDKGRPRLSQLQLSVDANQRLCLKVWDLKDNNNNTHDAIAKAKPSPSPLPSLSLNLINHSVDKPSVNTSHGNQIFIIRNRNVYQYDVQRNTQTKVAEIHSDFDGEMPYFSVFPFVLPAVGACALVLNVSYCTDGIKLAACGAHDLANFGHSHHTPTDHFCCFPYMTRIVNTNSELHQMVSESYFIAEDVDKKTDELIMLIISKEGEHDFIKKFHRKADNLEKHQQDEKNAITKAMVKFCGFNSDQTSLQIDQELL